jgi:uncharacterized membrane protein YdjX (TVP38/TMEM64 family)
MTADSGEAAPLELRPAGLRRAARLVLSGVLAAAAAAAWHWRAELDPASTGAAIARFPAAPLAFLLAHVAASLLFVPRTLLAIVAGLLFGMGWGIWWAALGSVAGAVAGLLVARYLGAGLIDPARGARLRPFVEGIERGGWRGVAVLRLIPVLPHSLTNYALGLTRLPLAPYAVGSLLGQLPLTVAYVELGAAGGRLMLGGTSWLEPTAIGGAALALSLLIPALARRRSR